MIPPQSTSEQSNTPRLRFFTSVWETLMLLPFKHKLAILFVLISLSISGGSVYLLYQHTRSILLEQIGQRLRDVGSVGAFLLGPEERAHIARLSQLVHHNALLLTKNTLAALPEGEIVPALPTATAHQFMTELGFQQVVQRLRQIKEGSRQHTRPYADFLQTPKDAATDPFSIKTVYLVIPFPGAERERLAMFIADSDYEDVPDMAGNAIGNIYRENSADPVLTNALRSGIAQTGKQFVTDKWYTFLAAGIPIKNAMDETIAVLGLDLDVSHEANRLQQLQWLGILLIGMMTVVAVVLSYAVAWRLSKPVQYLREAAEKVRHGDLNTIVHIRSHDELEVLAETFNGMVAQIREHTEQLEQKVTERTAALEYASKEIHRLNERLTADNLRMGTELEVARQLQQMVLPRAEEFLAIPELDIAGFMQPADEVGGDYYDVLHHDGRLKIGIGDVTGHGLESGVLMLMVQTAVRTLLANNVTDAQQFLCILNQVIYQNVQRMGSDKNLTLSLLDYRQGGHLTITGQHEEVLVVRANGQVERMDTLNLGFMVGMKQDIANWVRYLEVNLQPGDGIVLYTDGITEAMHYDAMNATDEFYGIERLCEVIGANWRQSALEIQDAVINSVRNHIGAGKPFDDITLVVVKQKNSAEPQGMTSNN